MIQKKRVIAAGKQYFLGLIAVVGVVSALWCQSFVSLAAPDVPGAEVEPDTVLDAQYAVISKESVNIRTAPSINDGVVDQLNRDAQVIVSGETQGSDGMTWYYVTFTGTSGTEKSGFIRSDLLALGEMVPVPDEEVPEPQEIEPEPEVEEHDDYELHQVLADDGSYVWYVYDYTGGEIPQKYPLQELMKVTRARSEEDAENARTIVKQRVAIIVLAVLLVLLLGVAVIAALKFRDVYYGEDEEEEEREAVPTQRRRRTQETEGSPIQRRRRDGSEEAATQRRRRTEEIEEGSARRRRLAQESEEGSARRRRRMEESEEETERGARRRAAREERGNDAQEVEYREDDAGSAPVKTAPKRKSKNFLLDDDEFEFEFLTMEDKDV